MNTAECYNCQNANEVRVSSGHNKPENKGRQYFTCAKCQQFNWVENGVGVSTSGMKVDYTKTPERRVPVKEEKADWDVIARGKVRHGVAVAFIERGEMFEDAKPLMKQWVDWIMTEL